MDEKEQNNKKHLTAKSGRKFQEDNKIKAHVTDKEVHLDSRGNALIKTKRKIDRINKKAFAIQNVEKAQKKIAMIVDRQTSRHTYKTMTEISLDCPQLITLMGPTGSGKSTLLRTLMRHYTGQRKTIEGPVTVVCSKKKRSTFLECNNDLLSMMDVAKVADMILLIVNVKQGLQTETLELIDILNAHGVPRVKLIYTHIDEYPKNDKAASLKMKEITKRIQTEIHAQTFQLTECKQMRQACNSEYKIEEVRNLARIIGQKNPLPNAWRGDHPYFIVDRIERNQLLSNGETDHLKFYGFVRGSAMSVNIKKMHLMGVDDVEVQNVEVLNDPCPTPHSENEMKVKRQPLAMKERKAYAPMCGYGGVLKDADGFHIITQSDPMGRKHSDDEDEQKPLVTSSLVQEFSSSEDEEDDEEIEDNDEPPAKKRLIDLNEESKLVEDFDELQNDMDINSNMINYERLIYDPDYVCKIDPEVKELKKDLFVTGTWGENEDAATLLRKDDEKRKEIKNESIKACDSDDDEDKDCEMDEDEDCEMDEGEDCEMDGDCDIDEEDENDEEDESNDDEEESDIGEQVSEMGADDYEEESDNGDNDDEDESDDDKTTDGTKGWTSDAANLSDFQKKKLEKDLKTKRQKRQEKKDKHKALFDKMYEEKSGGDSSTAFHDQWKKDTKEQELKNKEAFNHVDKESTYKFAGVQPGTYVSLEVPNLPKGFYANFKPRRPVILGGLQPGEEAYGMLSATFRIHRHYNIAQVIKTKDPIFLSIGWRRIQTFCNFYKEEHNFRKTYAKYSGVKGLSCQLAFLAPVVPVKTGFVAFQTFENSPQFRIAGLGSVQSRDDKLDIKKKLKRVGKPFKIFKKTAFISGMFQDELEVEQYNDSLIKTTSGVRGAVKKSINSVEPGTFRATFEAPISKADLVFLTCWASVKVMAQCQFMLNLVDEDFKYCKPWNEYMREKGIELPQAKPDSKYRKIERSKIVHAPFKLSQKVIDKLPFANRPPMPEPEDLVQKSRPKIVLDAKESKRVQLFDHMREVDEVRLKTVEIQKHKYDVKKAAAVKQTEEKKKVREKEKRQKFFQKASIKSGKASLKSKKGPKN